MPSLGVYTIMCTASGTAYHHGCCTVSGAFNASHPSPPSIEEGGAAIFAFRTFLRSSRPHRLLLHRRSLHQRLRCIVSGRPPAAYRLIDNALYRCQLYCTVAYCTVSLPTVLHRCLLYCIVANCTAPLPTVRLRYAVAVTGVVTIVVTVRLQPTPCCAFEVHCPLSRTRTRTHARALVLFLSDANARTRTHLSAPPPLRRYMSIHMCNQKFRVLADEVAKGVASGSTTPWSIAHGLTDTDECS